MANTYCIVGRIVSLKDNTIYLEVVCEPTSEDKITLPIVMKQTMADKVPGLFSKGDILGVKGHFGKTSNNKPILYADKISCLSSSANAAGVYSA